MSFRRPFRKQHRVLEMESLESRQLLHGGSLTMDPVPEPPDTAGARPVEAIFATAAHFGERLHRGFASNAGGSPNV